MIKAAGNIVTKKTIGNTLHNEGLKSCSARMVSLLKKAHVRAHLKFANESEENWVKVLFRWDQIQLFGINSTRRVWRRKNAAYDPKSTSPPSNMEVETLCFGGVFLLRGQDNCTASKGRWMGPCTVRARALNQPGHWKRVVDWYSSMTMTQNSQPRQQTGCGSRRSTLMSWSGLASLQTSIP